MKINVNNKEKIAAKINDVEEKSKTRFLQISDIEDAILRAEERLEVLNIPKTHWRDCSISIQAESVCHSYKWAAEGTTIKIKRFATGWFMVGCDRLAVRKTTRGGEELFQLTLSEDAYSQITKSFDI